LPLLSRTVTVIVEMAEPSATTPVAGEALAVVRTALMLFGSATKSTVGCCATTTWLAPGLTVAVIVLSSAVMLAIEPLATPKASVRPGLDQDVVAAARGELHGLARDGVAVLVAHRHGDRRDRRTVGEHSRSPARPCRGRTARADVVRIRNELHGRLLRYDDPGSLRG
jgi:hypothetical protein